MASLITKPVFKLCILESIVLSNQFLSVHYFNHDLGSKYDLIILPSSKIIIGKCQTLVFKFFEASNTESVGAHKKIA